MPSTEPDDIECGQQDEAAVWVLEFSAPSFGAAFDIVRQHTPRAEMAPDVQTAGRCGYEVRSGDYEWITGLRHALTERGRTTILERES